MGIAPAGETYTATFQRQRDGRWIVEIPDVPGCYAAGGTLADARDAIQVALMTQIEDSSPVEIVEVTSW